MHDPNYIKITTGLFIMLNPFVLIPVFLGLTGGMNKSQKMKAAITTCIAVFIIMMIAVF
jgi:small neutral amino acid transporter SnatA (MarC family)